MYMLAISKFDIPGEYGFPLNAVYSKPVSPQESGKKWTTYLFSSSTAAIPLLSIGTPCLNITVNIYFYDLPCRSCLCIDFIKNWFPYFFDFVYPNFNLILFADLMRQYIQQLRHETGNRVVEKVGDCNIITWLIVLVTSTISYIPDVKK